MREQFVTYEIALKLKELGFDEKCAAGYDVDSHEIFIGIINDEIMYNPQYHILAPLWQQCEQWFREKYNIHVLTSGRLIDSPESKVYVWEVYGDFEESQEELYDGVDKDYYQAREQAILKCIELCQKKDS